MLEMNGIPIPLETALTLISTLRTPNKQFFRCPQDAHIQMETCICYANCKAYRRSFRLIEGCKQPVINQLWREM